MQTDAFIEQVDHIILLIDFEQFPDTQEIAKPINFQQHKTTAFYSFQTLHYASHKHLNGICFPLKILLQEQTKQIKHEMGYPTPYASNGHPLSALLITRQNDKDALGLTWSNHCPQTLSFLLVCHIKLLETLVVYFQ